MLPTMVCVADCSDADNVVYHFGYEAQKDTQIKYYDESFSIFYEIKRWVNSYHNKQEIIDKEGNTALVERRQIIREYLLYVIQCAQQRFKCRFKHLHLTSPVKLKQQYNQMFKELLYEYEIDDTHMLDEGTAVIYNTIHNLIEKQRYYDGEEIAALIIDCGGGTTDLSSCNFVIENDSISYKVAIETTYENGDTNFGGNNITYRIMQYIKIMFAKHYSEGGQVRIDDLMEVASEDIFRFVDEFGRDAVYEKLERAYEEAEAIIPIKFKNYENHTRDEYFMVKNNFYFLYTTVASVDATGKVTAINAGTATIKAIVQKNNLESICQITVEGSAITDPEVTEPDPEIEEAEEDGLPNTAVPPSNPIHHCTGERGGSDYTEWGYVYFGSYPQSEVTDAGTISAIDAALLTLGQTKGDVEVDGIRYRKVGKSDANQTNNFGDNEYRYFKWEPIKWKVLSSDDSKLFLLADQALDCNEFNESYKSVTWETSTIRSWLNGYGSKSNEDGISYTSDSFYRNAFTALERGAILTTTIL